MFEVKEHHSSDIDFHMDPSKNNSSEKIPWACSDAIQVAQQSFPIIVKSPKDVPGYFFPFISFIH